MEYEGTRLRSAETTRSASVREVPLHSSRRVREPSVRQDLIGYVGFAASISTAPTAAVGRVLPGTSLARAAAVQRIAGIRCPVAVGSVRVWPEQSPRVDRARTGRR